jgi:hypothetical protein
VRVALVAFVLLALCVLLTRKTPVPDASQLLGDYGFIESDMESRY